VLAEGRGTARNCDKALIWLRQSPEQKAREMIDRVEQETAALDENVCISRDVVVRIRTGDSVLGMRIEGNTLLQTAARY
jgi:LPS sulfotransferase NodH